jgi:hypothetical protein
METLASLEVSVKGVCGLLCRGEEAPERAIASPVRRGDGERGGMCMPSVFGADFGGDFGGSTVTTGEANSPDDGVCPGNVCRVGLLYLEELPDTCSG